MKTRIFPIKYIGYGYDDKVTSRVRFPETQYFENPRDEKYRASRHTAVYEKSKGARYACDITLLSGTNAPRCSGKCDNRPEKQPGRQTAAVCHFARASYGKIPDVSVRQPENRKMTR